MAKFTTPIDEDTRQRVLALPKGVKFSAFVRKAITVFVEELEKDPGLRPEDFVVALAARNRPPGGKGV